MCLQWVVSGVGVFGPNKVDCELMFADAEKGLYVSSLYNAL